MPQSIALPVALGALLTAVLSRGAMGQVAVPDLPHPGLVEAYRQAAQKNVLAAVNHKVFKGYWSVCADGQGFGYGNTYPSLDGHQLADALLWLGEVDTVKANWDYVRRFQRKDGLLPIAILPGAAGQKIGPPGATSPVEPNGALYQHWVPGNPLGALASPTYIQNADVLFRHTQDRAWLAAQMPSVNLAADYLASLTTPQGAVKGAGYYLERPLRFESDGVTQCYAVDAFRRVAALNRVLGDDSKARRYDALAERIRRHFTTKFWVGDHFAEYLHPQRGLIAHHGLTDVDWAAIAADAATAEQAAVLWPRLKDEKRFHYGGMPTGIATRPETYEDWEFSHADRHDLAAMGRVWYLEAWARTRRGDAAGLLDGLAKVAEVGRRHGYSWRERYHPDGKGGSTPAGPDTYCEYPANLIRIVQEFLLGVEHRLDGSVLLAPTVTPEFARHGFGQTLVWQGRRLEYRFLQGRIAGSYAGSGPQRLAIRWPSGITPTKAQATIDGQPAEIARDGDVLMLTLPAAPAERPCRFALSDAGDR